jgi:hypothetical protein
MRKIHHVASTFVLLWLGFAAICIWPYSFGQALKRIKENGVEVVVNGPKPVAVKGQPSGLTLREEFRIDLEDDKIAALGLGDISRVDLDSNGRIYIAQAGWPGKTVDLVYLFDARGRFLRSFGRIGQGPGELTNTHYLALNVNDELPVFDKGSSRITYFDSTGRVARTVNTAAQYWLPQLGMYFLENGNCFSYSYTIDEKGTLQEALGSICGADYKKVQDLIRYDLWRRLSEYKDFLSVRPVSAISKNTIYLAQPIAGKDISVYDPNGQLVRKIRASFPQVGLTAGHLAEMMSPFPKNYPEFKDVKFPDNFPPFLALFADDKERLYVAGFEEDATTKMTLCDVFAPDGSYILRAGIGFRDLSHYMLGSQYFDVAIKKDRLVCVRGKPSGFKEVVVFSMIWK